MPWLRNSWPAVLAVVAISVIAISALVIAVGGDNPWGSKLLRDATVGDAIGLVIMAAVFFTVLRR